MSAEKQCVSVGLPICLRLIAAQGRERNPARVHITRAGRTACAMDELTTPENVTGEGPIPAKQEILSVLRRVNAWQLAHPVMKSDDRNWKRATWYTGVMAAWKATKDPAFLQQALKWGRQQAWQVGTEPNGANRFFCVET